MIIQAVSNFTGPTFKGMLFNVVITNKLLKSVFSGAIVCIQRVSLNSEYLEAD